ncbi:MAG: DUF418 domain-containing protein [Xanthobacteraceae bacterium]
MDSASPIAPSERIGTIDILRGLALFIVLMINTTTEFRVSIFEQFLRGVKSAGLADQISGALVLALHTKGFILFSFLFGVGLAIQFERLAGHDRRLALTVRRLAILMAIGVAHLFLIWNGDILTEYSVVGLIALPLLYSPRWPLAAAAALSLALYLASPWLPPPISFPDGAWIARHVERARQVYGGGSFMEILAFRIEEVRYIAPLHVYVLPRTLGLFLLGAWVWRTNFFRPTAPRRFLMAMACLMLSLGGWMTFATANGDVLGWHLNWQARAFFQSLAQLVLAAGYGAVIVVLAEHASGRKLVAWAGPLGRMAFTNYLAQSVILSCIFYGFGLALFGRLSVAQSIAVAVAIYAAQAAFSMWWLRRFRFGPIEWLWRSLMYGEWQSFPARRLTA